MIISKANMNVVNCTREDKNIPALNNIHITKDGSTVGIGGKMLMAVSPVLDKLKNKISNVLIEKGKGEITINAETIRHAIKDMPADRKFSGLLEHCNIKKLEDNEVRITMTDGKRKRSMIGKLYDREYLPYKVMIKKAMEQSNKGDSKKVVLNLKRFILLLQAIEKSAPDKSGENPVYIEFTDDNDVIIRAVNMVTEQRVLGIMSSYSGVEGKWLELNNWEKSFLKKKIKLKKKYRLRLRKK